MTMFYSKHACEQFLPEPFKVDSVNAKEACLFLSENTLNGIALSGQQPSDMPSMMLFWDNYWNCPQTKKLLRIRPLHVII